MGRPLEPLTYTLPEGATVLGLSLHAVQRLIASGELPVMRYGRRVLIVRSVLDDWVKANATTRFEGRSQAS